MPNTQDASKPIVPSDLALVVQPDIDKNYFNVTVKDLKINKTYAIQFQWVELDGKLGSWSPGFIFTTSNETAPAVPTSVTVPSTASGSIPVTLSAFPTNAKRVDVIITGGIFGTSTVAHSFSAAGTTTIAAPAGTYIVQLRSISPTGVTSTVGTTFTITITSADIVVLPSTTPSTPTVSSTLGAIQLAWNGKTSSGADQPSGFVAAKVYVGTTSGFTPVDTGSTGANQVDVLNFANGQNTLNIAVGTVVNGVAMDYGIDYFIKIKTTNGNAAQDSAAVLATGSPARIGQVGNGDIVEITADKIRTGTISSQIVTVGTTAGKHVKLSGSGDPLTIYGTGGTSDPLLSFSTNGSNQSVLTIKGNGTFTGNISGASGTFSGDLSSSNGQFSVTSGIMSALAGNIGGWQINSSVLKNSTQSFPAVLLDPVESKIHLRGSPGASDTGNVIKMDTTTGLRVGPTADPKFKVDMSGNLEARDATLYGKIITTGANPNGFTGTLTIDSGYITQTNQLYLNTPFLYANTSSVYLQSLDGYFIMGQDGGVILGQGNATGDLQIRLNVTTFGEPPGKTYERGYLFESLYDSFPDTAQLTTSSQLGGQGANVTVGYGNKLMRGRTLYSGNISTTATLDSVLGGANTGDLYFSTA